MAIALCPRAAPAAPFEVALHVREDAGIARASEPLASGIPLPRGAVMDPADVRVYAPDGRPVPCQAHQLGLSWPDGSLRWVLLQFPATVEAGGDAVYVLRADPDTAATVPQQPVAVQDLGDEVQVTTGPLRFSVLRSDFRLPNALELRSGGEGAGEYAPVLAGSGFSLRADREYMTPDEFYATGREGKDLATYGIADTGAIQWGKLQQGPEGKGIDYSGFLGGPVRIAIEEAGPLRAVVRVERDAEKKEGEVGFVARLFAYAGKPYLRVEYTLESYELFTLLPTKPMSAICNSKHVREFTYRLRPAAGVTGVAFGLPAAAPGGTRLNQPDPGTCAITDAGGATVARGERAPGWMSASIGSHTLTVATKWFWEMAPRAMSHDADAGELRLELRPEDAPGTGYPIPAGRVKTYDFVLGVDTPGPQLSTLARSPLRAYPDPEYVTATGATHRFVPLADDRFSKFADYVRRTRERAAKVRLYGDIDFGDQIGWNENERWGSYHGTTHEWFMFYLASGDPELFRIAEQETWHSLDVDTQHWGYMPGVREAEYARKQDHVCAANYQGGIKVWTFGETDYYLLTGSRRVLGSLRRTADFLLTCGGVGGGVHVPERATSLPFLHLAYLYLVMGDESALATAWPEAMKSGTGGFRGDCVGVEKSAGWLAIMKEISEYFNGVYDRKEHVRSSFLASYPAEAYHRYYELTGDPRAREGLLKAADFLYQDMTMPLGCIMYAGGAPWSEDSPWQPWADGVDGPAAVAWMLTHDNRYLDYGKAPVDWILNYRGYAYSSGPWSFQGAMGFGGTLSMYLWAMREAGMTQADLIKPRTDLDLDRAVRVSIERCNEWRDRSMGNTPYSGLYCRLAAEIGRVLINQGKYDEAIAWLEPWKPAAYGVYIDMALDRAKTLKEGTGTP